MLFSLFRLYFMLLIFSRDLILRCVVPFCFFADGVSAHTHAESRTCFSRSGCGTTPLDQVLSLLPALPRLLLLQMHLRAALLLARGRRTVSALPPLPPYVGGGCNNTGRRRGQAKGGTAETRNSSSAAVSAVSAVVAPPWVGGAERRCPSRPVCRRNTIAVQAPTRERRGRGRGRGRKGRNGARLTGHSARG